MLKRLLVIILTLSLVLSFSGCTDKKPVTDKTENDNSSFLTQDNDLTQTENDNSSSLTQDNDLTQTENDSSVQSQNNNSTQNDDLAQTDNNSSTGTGEKTVYETIEVPAKGIYIKDKDREKQENSNTEIDPKYLLSGDTTIKDEIKLGKYKFVWSDEFNGSKLSNLWTWYDGITYASDTYQTMDCIKVSNGTLKMSASRYYDPSNSAYKWKNSPTISTKSSFAYKFGYLEMRARVPYKQGAWPSFWLVSTDAVNNVNDVFKNYGIEIDIFEVFCSSDTATPNIHKWGSTHSQIMLRNTYTFDNIEHLNDEYHVYGFEWTDKEMSMYIDGVKYNTFDMNYNFDNGEGGMEGFKKLHTYIILGNELQTRAITPEPGKLCVDEGATPTEFPIEYEIDWIRLYQDSTGSISQK